MREVSDASSVDESAERRRAQDELIIAALVSGGSYEEAASAAGVSARTVRRRMSEEAFAAEVRSLRAERASRLSAGLLELGGEAIRVLAEAMDDESPSVSLRAAQTVLTLGQRYRREVEMAERIDALERQLKALATSDGSGEEAGSEVS